MHVNAFTQQTLQSLIHFLILEIYIPVNVYNREHQINVLLLRIKIMWLEHVLTFTILLFLFLFSIQGSIVVVFNILTVCCPCL